MDPTDAADGTLPPGSTISHYRVLGVLGRGGMGIVYRAVDVNLGREVAIKCVRPDRADAVDSRRRMLREARAASRLAHPNIVTVHEVIDFRDAPAIVMELVDGPNLKRLLSGSHPLPVEDLLRYAEGVAEALGAAHEKGILHRDVNPNNIMIAGSGHALLTDFGLVRTTTNPDGTADSSTLSASTDSGVIVGTPGYFSPEQILGRPIDARSDLFALGVVLYEMCTGTSAFPVSPKGEMIDAILNREPVAISRLNRAIPAELERVVRKAMAKRADERYRDARDIAADLRVLRRRIESGTYSGETPLRSQPWWRGLYGAAAAAFLVIGVAVGAFIIRHQGSGNILLEVPRQLTSGPGPEQMPGISPDGTLVAFCAESDGKSGVWLVDVHGGNPLRLADDTATACSPAWFPNGSYLAFVSDHGKRPEIWKVPRLGGPAVPLLPDAEDPAISPDGTRVAFVRIDDGGQYRIWVAPIADTSLAKALTGDRDGLWDHRHPAWSPDGHSICYEDFQDLWVLRLSGGRPERLTADQAADRWPAWSPDGRYVYFTSFRDGTHALWRVASGGGAPSRLTFGTGPETQPSLSRDGARLAYSTYSRNSDLVVLDLQAGSTARLEGERGEWEPALSPDGAILVFTSDRDLRGQLWAQPLLDGRPAGAPSRLTDGPGTVAHPEFSPDGKLIAHYRMIGGKRNLWLMPASGGPPRPLTEGPSVDIHPSWSPDGTHVAFISNRSGKDDLWVASVGGRLPDGSPRRVTDVRMEITFPAWSPDGGRLAFVGNTGGRAELWVVPLDGASSAIRITDGARASCVQWDGSGRSLLVAGTWGTNRREIRRVSFGGGPPQAFDPPLVCGDASSFGNFSLSGNGRFLAYTSESVRGDIWVMEAASASR